MNKKLNTEQQTRKSKNAECEKAVSLRHGLGVKDLLKQKLLLESKLLKIKAKETNSVLEKQLLLAKSKIAFLRATEN